MCAVRARAPAPSGGGDGVRVVVVVGGGVLPSLFQDVFPFLLLSVAVLLALSPSPGRRGLLWLPSNNGEGAVFKEVHVINDCSCIILAFFLRCHAPPLQGRK